MSESCRLGNNTERQNAANPQDESLCMFNVFCVLISLVTILADLTTVILVLAEYCSNGHFYWAGTTLIFILVPNILINTFSMRWIVIDQKSNAKHWITHCFLIGHFERYTIFLQKVFTCKNFECMKSKELISQRNDLSLLHFLYTFTGTVPQIILQTCAMATLDEKHDTKAISLTAATSSVLWACASYIYSISWYQEHFQWQSFSLKLVWQFGMLLARVSAILLFSVIFGLWTFIPLGLHWAAMTFWIVTQETTFCPNKLEETFYNIVMGFVYCFCYINLRQGQTRYRLLVFYSFVLSQNFTSLFLYIIISDIERQRKLWSIVATISVVSGTVIGLCGMILYYRWFHAKGPISWKNIQNDVELNNKVTTGNTQTTLCHVRSFKSSNKTENIATTRIDSTTTPTKHDIDNADKKFLLDHWIARSGTPTFISAPIGNNSMDVTSIDFHTIDNTPALKEDKVKNIKQKKKLSPNELILKLTALENKQIQNNTANIHKRRAICSSDELKDDFCKTKNDEASEASHETDGSNKKTSSDSIDMDLDLSLSDINSSDINTFNENIVQKLCLSALKNIKVGNQDADIENIQRIALDILKDMYSKIGKKHNSKADVLNQKRDVETPTELLSVHDYENICAVNIAREAWGLRSWNGYCDIENWMHDGSVGRDRCSATLTSGSSEISSCLSQDLKNSILSAPVIPKRVPTYSNVFVKSNPPVYVNAEMCDSDETFLARPCLADFKDHLEPILEELDDLGDMEVIKSLKKKRLNSESSLVATIDEIRKVTITNSPRNLYHRREHVWDSPQFNSSVKIETNLKRALWKEPSKLNSNNILKVLPEKDQTESSPSSKLSNSSKSNLSFQSLPSSSSMHSTPTSSKIKSTNIKSHKQINNSLEELNDFSSKDIDMLWKYVSESSAHASSIEDLGSTQISSSLQSLIGRNQPIKNSNTRKGKSKPRRKFSILRERFEPRSHKNPTEISTSRQLKNIPSVIQVKNQLDDKQGTSIEVKKLNLSKSNGWKTDDKYRSDYVND